MGAGPHAAATNTPVGRLSRDSPPGSAVKGQIRPALRSASDIGHPPELEASLCKGTGGREGPVDSQTVTYIVLRASLASLVPKLSGLAVH